MIDDTESLIQHIDGLRMSADAERPWFIAARPTNDGLSIIEDGRRDGMFQVTGETREIELIVAMHNAWPAIREALQDNPIPVTRLVDLFIGRKK